jgi:hypothetical protein
MTKLPPTPNDLLTLITLLAFPLKLDHINHINLAWKKQANEKQIEKHTLNIPPQAGIVWSTQYKDP